MPVLTIPTPFILFISAAGIVQAVFLAGLLYFHPKSDRSVTIFLSLHILTIAVFMMMPVAQLFFTWHTIILLVPFQFLIGPGLYLYVRSFKERVSWQKAWSHFLLFAGFFIADIFYYFYFRNKYPSADSIPEAVLFSSHAYVHIIVRNIQMLGYYFLSRRELNRYQKSIRHLYSETSRISLSWVRWFVNGFLLLIITVFILFFLVVQYPQNFSLWILINTAVITPYIYAVTFKGIGQLTLWQIEPGKNKENIEKEIVQAQQIELSVKQMKPAQIIPKGFPDTKLNEILSRITALMEKDKLYQEPELTLQALADQTGIPPYQVSQVINDGFKKSFYDLINGYRVEEAKRLLLDPKNNNYTILSVGFEAGFNSKTTFNTVFKKFTGQTPTEYKLKKVADKHIAAFNKVAE